MNITQFGENTAFNQGQMLNGKWTALVWTSWYPKALYLGLSFTHSHTTTVIRSIFRCDFALSLCLSQHSILKKQTICGVSVDISALGCGGLDLEG